MAYIESHQTLSRHKKLLRLVRYLGEDKHKLIGHLHELWWWAIDNVPSDGDLGDLDDEEIAIAAEWQGDPEAFCRALTDAGFIDQTPEGRYLHDWHEYAGKLLDRRAADRERKRRAKEAQGIRRKSAGIPAEWRADSVSTVTNPTVTNPSGENHSPQPPSPPPAQPQGVDAPEPEPPADGRPTQEWVEWLVRLYAYYAPVTGKAGVGANVRRNEEMTAAIRAGAKPETLAQVIRENAAAGMAPWDVREEACRRDGIGVKPRDGPGRGRRSYVISQLQEGGAFLDTG